MSVDISRFMQDGAGIGKPEIKASDTQQYSVSYSIPYDTTSVVDLFTVNYAGSFRLFGTISNSSNWPVIDVTIREKGGGVSQKLNAVNVVSSNSPYSFSFDLFLPSGVYEVYTQTNDTGGTLSLKAGFSIGPYLYPVIS